MRNDSLELDRIRAELAASEHSIATLAATKLPQVQGVPAGSGSAGLPNLPVLAPIAVPAVHAVTGASGVP
ncbi:MAG: hypothetical protein ACYCO3_03640 [Mycobacteriales bacterium]